jgi:uncharacterized membrane protein YhhN
VYSLIIGLMLTSALWSLIKPDQVWRPGPALLTSAGALLFFISDTLLAWNRFVAPVSGGRTLEHICYHLGQYALVGGVALNLLSMG